MPAANKDFELAFTSLSECIYTKKNRLGVLSCCSYVIWKYFTLFNDMEPLLYAVSSDITLVNLPSDIDRMIVRMVNEYCMNLRLVSSCILVFWQDNLNLQISPTWNSVALQHLNATRILLPLSRVYRLHLQRKKYSVNGARVYCACFVGNPGNLMARYERN